MKFFTTFLFFLVSLVVFSSNDANLYKLNVFFEDEIVKNNDVIPAFIDTTDESIVIQDKGNKKKDTEFLGAPLFDSKDFWRFFLKTIFNLFIVLIIVRGVYYPVTRNKDYLFTYLLIGLTVFVLCFLLDDVKLSTGFALGLFAIFGIIRYRTDTIPIKEMTYLFVVIGISVVNALANKKISHLELVFANVLVVFVTYGMERLWLLKHESKKNVVYEKIELIVPEKKDELLIDLKSRTGLDIIRFEITKIDFLRDVAIITVFYNSLKDEK